ncbi:MAG: FKBP-type peptidyl-prolyl cis-trans isomerase [Betaproteobacteria bacterium]|nr:FKBP-type peptidyl-prolyl cis-trans isomerase [Betaproteobacteria bacterium]
MNEREDTETPRVQAGSFLTLHYRIASLETPILFSGEEVESAAGNSNSEFLSTFDLSPATLQLGSGQLAPALEACLIGLPAGARKIFHLPPEAAFGARNPHLIERIARNALPAGVELAENTLVEFSTPNGAAFTGFLRQLDEQGALFDFNHPLAGKSIEFEVWILGIL